MNQRSGLSEATCLFRHPNVCQDPGTSRLFLVCIIFAAPNKFLAILLLHLLRDHTIVVDSNVLRRLHMIG